MYSFAKNKKKVDLFPYIRRICDLTTPNLATVCTGRSEERFNRAIPTLLCPWEGDGPLVDEHSIGLTCDLADRGARLVLNQPFYAERAVLGFWIAADEMPHPWFFLVDVRRSQPIGGGFWSLGVELKEFANEDHQESLQPLKHAAARLLAPAPVAP